MDLTSELRKIQQQKHNRSNQIDLNEQKEDLSNPISSNTNVSELKQDTETQSNNNCNSSNIDWDLEIAQQLQQQYQYQEEEQKEQQQQQQRRPQPQHDPFNHRMDIDSPFESFFQQSQSDNNNNNGGYSFQFTSSNNGPSGFSMVFQSTSSSNNNMNHNPAIENLFDEIPFGFGNFMRINNSNNIDNMDYEQLLNLFPVVQRGLNQNEINNNSIEDEYKQKKDEKKDNKKNNTIKGDVNKECCICLEPFKDKDKIRRLPCLHIFHKDEIDHWLKTKDSCPVCRLSIKGGGN